MKELKKSTLRVMKRNDVLADVAKAAGWANWSEYQTAVIHGQVEIQSKRTNDVYTSPIGSWIETGKVDEMYNVNAA
jgi:hypothetical protein